jgi:hypothetical protein
LQGDSSRGKKTFLSCCASCNSHFISAPTLSLCKKHSQANVASSPIPDNGAPQLFLGNRRRDSMLGNWLGPRPCLRPREMARRQSIRFSFGPKFYSYPRPICLVSLPR